MELTLEAIRKCDIGLNAASHSYPLQKYTGSHNVREMNVWVTCNR